MHTLRINLFNNINHVTAPYLLRRLGQIGVLIFMLFFFTFNVLRLCSLQESICCRVTGSLGSVDFLCTEVCVKSSESGDID